MVRQLANENDSYERTSLKTFETLLAEMDKWELERLEFAKKHPILAKIKDIYRSLRWSLNNPGPIWWIKYRIIPKHKYHVIYTKLSPGYHDPSARILSAVFGELEDWANRDYHTDGYIVSGRIAIPKAIVGDVANVSYDTGEPATEDDIEYYLMKKDTFDDLREVYLWWIKIGRDPDRWIEEQCWENQEDRKNPENIFEREEMLSDEIKKMLVKVITHYRELWN